MLLRIVNGVEPRREVSASLTVEVPAVHRRNEIERENSDVLLGYLDDPRFVASCGRHGVVDAGRSGAF